MYILSIRNILVIIVTLVMLFGCSEDNGPIVDEILLTVNKNVALSMGDSILIMTEVLSEVDERLQNIPLEYFVDDTRLAGPVFYPDRPGTFRISARYQDIVSSKKDVEVISLEDNITSLDLIYTGHRYLTTEKWSVSGPFFFDVQLNNQEFELETNSIDLLVNGVPVLERNSLHFNTPGEYSVSASFGSLQSAPVTIHVREKLDIEEVTIPLVFHDFGINLSSGQLSKLVDTLNGAFSSTSFELEDVINGEVNPNAVNLKMKFELANEAPEGFVLSSLGIQKINVQDDGEADLESLIIEHSWDPDKYVNIWITDGEFLEEGNSVEYLPFPRGNAHRPMIRDIELEGLVTTTIDEHQTTAGLTVNALSVFGEHPDYLITTMGIYYGLYQTFELGCTKNGDYLDDTRTISFEGRPPTGYYYDCNNELNRPSNFLSINRNYRDFTYDQAIRIRAVMKHGLSRVGE